MFDKPIDLNQYGTKRLKKRPSPSSKPAHTKNRTPWSEPRRRTYKDKLINLSLAETHVLEAIQHARYDATVNDDYLTDLLKYDTSTAVERLIARKLIRQERGEYVLW